jgi:hypothetical protein
MLMAAPTTVCSTLELWKKICCGNNELCFCAILINQCCLLSWASDQEIKSQKLEFLFFSNSWNLDSPEQSASLNSHILGKNIFFLKQHKKRKKIGLYWDFNSPRVK